MNQKKVNDLEKDIYKTEARNCSQRGSVLVNKLP